MASAIDHRQGCSRRELANLPLFVTLAPASLHALILRSRLVRLEAGEALFCQGDASKSLYVVIEGAVTPIAEGESRRKLAVIERGGFVGEIGLVTGQPRNATVAALVDSKLLAIDRGVLFPLMRREPALARAILRPLGRRMLDRQLRTNLFFAAFSQAERQAVARQFRRIAVADGTRVVAQGEPPEGLFVVLSGSFAQVDRASGRELGRFELGDVFGGHSLLEGKASPHDVVARGKAWLIVLGERRLRRIVDAHPRLLRVVQRLASRHPGAPAPPAAPPVLRASSPRPTRPGPAARAASAGTARRSRS
jgi:CRP-like cAMP-binding protein